MNMQERDKLSANIDPPRPSISAALGMVLLAAVGLWVASFAVGLMPESGQWQNIAANLLFYLPFIAMPIAFYSARRGGLSGALRLNPMPVGPMLLSVLLAMMSVLAATELDYLWLTLLNALGLHEPQTALAMEGADAGALMINILNAAALPAICEELLFRGFVLSAWEVRGTRRAILMSSALFALLHGNLFGLPAYGLVGAISAALAVASDSLYVSMTYHTVYNAAVLVILHISSAMQAQTASMGDAAALPSLFSVVTELLMLLAMMAALLAMMLRRRAADAQPAPPLRAPLTRRERALLALTLAVLLGTIVILLLVGGGA